MKLSKNFTRTLFFIIFSCFFQTILTASAAFKSAEPDIIPHYNLRNTASSETPNNTVSSVEKVFHEITYGSETPDSLKNLFLDCEIEPNGKIETKRENQVYFVRKTSKLSDKKNCSHLVIKKLAPDCRCENHDLNEIFKMWHRKKIKLGLSNNFSFAMPECTLTFLDEENTATYFTVYREAKGITANSMFRNFTINTKYLANYLGEALFRLHECTRLTKQELESLASKTDEINISRYYSDSSDLTFAVATAELLNISDPLVRMVLVRCMGDFHAHNVFVRESKVTFIDYTTLARDTMNRNKCSLFTNDISYFMYCCVYFYGENFISTTGIDFLGDFSAAYFRNIHPQYHEKMLRLVKTGFNFFIEELTVGVTAQDKNMNLAELESNIAKAQKTRDKYINELIQILQPLSHKHGINYNSSNNEILDALNDYSDTRRFLKNDFIEGVSNKTKQILSQTSWESIQKEKLRKVIQSRKTRIQVSNTKLYCSKN